MPKRKTETRAVTEKSYAFGPEIDADLLAPLPDNAPCVLADLRHEIVVARNHGRFLSIALVSIEPNRGSSKADQMRRVTRRLLQLVATTLRHTDKCGLLSDREIVAILPTADEAGARIAMERLMNSGFAKVSASLDLTIRVQIAELDPAEAAATAFVDRARDEIDVFAERVH